MPARARFLCAASPRQPPPPTPGGYRAGGRPRYPRSEAAVTAATTASVAARTSTATATAADAEVVVAAGAATAAATAAVAAAQAAACPCPRAWVGCATASPHLRRTREGGAEGVEVGTMRVPAPGALHHACKRSHRDLHEVNGTITRRGGCVPASASARRCTRILSTSDAESSEADATPGAVAPYGATT